MLKELESGLLVSAALGDAHPGLAYAKVINPLLSVEARGRFGGIVYNTWHGISYAKAHSGPNQPNSAAQLAARARLVTVGADWRDLTQVQRDAWSVYADAHPEQDWTGNPLRLTGQNWFIRCNVQLSRAGLAGISAPPGIAAPDPVTAWVASDPNGAIAVTWTTPDDAALTLDVSFLGPVSTGVDPKIEHAVGLIIMKSNIAHPKTVLVAPATGRYRFWVKVIDDTTGLTSTVVSSLIDYTAP